MIPPNEQEVKARYRYLLLLAAKQREAERYFRLLNERYVKEGHWPHPGDWSIALGMLAAPLLLWLLAWCVGAY